MSDSNKNPKGKYVKATGLYTIGNIFNRAISLLLLPVLTRLLSTSSYGVVSTYNSWVTIATVVVGLQLYMSLRTAVKDYKDNLNAYISAIDSLITVSFAVFLVLGTVIGYFFLKNVPLILIILCIIHAFMTSIVQVELQRQMMQLEYVKRTLLLSLPNLIAALLAIAIISIFPQTDYMGRIGSNVGVFIAFGTVILIVSLKKGKTFYNREYWKYGLVLSIPLIFHGLACDILSSFDRTMITAFRSSAETGVYSVAYTLGMAIKVITSSVEGVWIPWFTKNMGSGNKKNINNVARQYIMIVSVICIAAMMCLPEILKLFADKSYWDGIYIIPPVVLASFITFLYSISVDTEYYYKATKSIAINTLIAAGSNLILNWIFIPMYGGIAAAYTTVASYLISFVIHYCVARKLDHELFPITMYIFPILLGIAGTAATYLLIGQWIIRWVVAFVMVGAFGIVLMKKNNIKLSTIIKKK